AATPVKNVNITYVATLQNLVYAIDVDRREICWKTQLPGALQPGGQLLGIDPNGEGGIGVGIVSTPVIDLKKSWRYVVARVFDAPLAHYFLHTLDTRTGAVVARVELDETKGCNGKPFQPKNHNNRPGLLLVNDKLFLAFGGTAGEDSSVEYHGFVFGFDMA